MTENTESRGTENKREDWSARLATEMALLAASCVLREKQGKPLYRSEDLKLLAREIIHQEDFYGDAWLDGFRARGDSGV